MTKRSPVPITASTLIDGRLHLHERHVHYGTPGHSEAIRAKGKTTPGKRINGGPVAVGWIDIELFHGQRIWITRAAAARLLDRQTQWVDRLTEARLVRHLVDGTGELWLHLDPAWTADHFEQVFNSTVHRPKTLADFDAYELGRGLFGQHSETPHPDSVLDAAVDFLSEAGVFGKAELRGIITLPLEADELMKDLWKRYLGRSRAWKGGRASLDLETFRMLLPPAIANARGTCWDEQEPDDWPAPPPQILAGLARLEIIRDQASLFMLLAAGRGVTTPYLTRMLATCRLLDELLAAHGGDPREQSAMDAVLKEITFGDEVDLNQSTRFDHARVILLMVQQLDAVARRSTREDGKDLRPFTLAGPFEAAGFRKALNVIGEQVKEESARRRKKSSDALSDAFGHVLAVARRRCDQVADVTDDVLVEVAALSETESDYLDAETTSYILNEDGTYADGLQTIHLRVWKADRLWIRLHEKGLLIYEPWARNQVRAGLASGDHFEKGKYYFEYRGVTALNGSTPRAPWFARLFQCAATITPGNLPLELREKRIALIKEWQLPGWRPMKGGFLSFRDSTHVYRMAAMDGIVLMPLEEFDHAMRAAHLAFRAGMVVGCRVNETLQMAHRGSEWPVLEVGSTARTGWMAVPKQSGGGGVDGNERQKRFFMCDDDTFRYFTELAQTVIRRSHPEGGISAIPAAPSLRWKTAEKPYVFSLDGQALHADYVNVSLRYLLAGVAVCTLHDARHAAANRGWVEGESLEDTMLRLGHASARMSKYYRSATASQADVAAAMSIDRQVRGESLRYWESLFA